MQTNGIMVLAWQWTELVDFWPHITACVVAVLNLVASGHVVLHKRDTRAAIGWVGVIWLTPVVGSLLYVWLGINRIRRRARQLRGGPTYAQRRGDENVCLDEMLASSLTGQGQHLRELVRLGDALTKRPLLSGNQIDPLVGSGQAYPAMLEAIEAASRSLTLSTYIFNNDQAGQQFVTALEAAVARGVEVRVLIDAIGSRYGWPTILGPLRKAAVPVARFMPPLVPVWFPYSNLRNHRKILVADGRIGFTGGMNIRESGDPDPGGRTGIQDLHFRIQGPVVRHLQQVFADDWEFSTRESLNGEDWFPSLGEQGPVLARGISDGPDEDLDKFRLTLLGAIACAQSSVQIMTPYFLPDAALITSLNVAAMRGVQVDILLPQVNNLTLVQWASAAMWWQLLEYNCRIWLTPPPFEHTKLMLIDGHWSLVGSGNWDPRSLRLNFEFNVECYNRQLATRLGAFVEDKRSRSRPVTLAEVDGRKLPVKLRDGVARLFSPYL